jgi:Ca2+-binding RTX toxin-like protein
VRNWHVEINGEPDSVQTPLITHVNILGNGGNDKITIVGLPAGVFEKVYTAGGNDSLTVEEMSLGDVKFYAGGGSNSLTYFGTDFLGGAFDPQTDYEITPTNIQWNGTPRVSFSNVKKLNFIGSAGNDTIKVLSEAAGQSFSVDGQQGNDTIRVGNFNITNNIKGDLKLVGGTDIGESSGDDTVVFENQKTTGDVDTLTYAEFNSFGMAKSIKYNTIDHVAINETGQNDLVNISSTSSKTLAVNTGAGNDVINVGNNVFGLGGVATTALTINAGSGDDMISANDIPHAGKTTYLLTPGKFARTGSMNWSVNQIERFDLFSGTGNNLIDGSAVGIPFNVHAGNGNDIIFGSFANDSIWGGAGNDLIHGDAGDDCLDGGAGQDSVAGGAGKDTLSLKDGEKDTYDGGPGSDTFIKDGIDVAKTIV